MALKRNKTLFLAFLCLFSLGIGCTSSNSTGTSKTEVSSSGPSTETPLLMTLPAVRQNLVVYAAASLTGAFQEISTKFELDNPGVRVSLNLAGSQILRTQLEQGALADVFAAADHKNMDLLVADHLASAENIVDFATNSLIVILPTGNPGQVTSLTELAKPGIKLVLADASVPAGDYARQVLTKMSQDPEYGADFYKRVQANVVSNETDVKQVVAKVELGEADAGMVYRSDAVAAPELNVLSIPAQYNVVANYPITILTNAPVPDVAAQFVGYVMSFEGQKILVKWGFSPMVP